MILSEFLLHGTGVLVQHLVRLAVTLYLGDVLRDLIEVPVDLFADDAEHVVRDLSQLGIELVGQELHASAEVLAKAHVLVPFLKVFHHVVERFTRKLLQIDR